ncbi:hypothetical protein ABZ400_02085 [Streptomyces sp. NPDC005897]|uniref:hypothetical protein n=1 Tax=Streptomyces sp. NPDC005897 TaxID=3157081 RepID=UPI0033DAD11B
MTSTQPETPVTSQPDAIGLHWVMTVQTNDVRQATNDGKISAVPGVHTRETTFQAVQQAMTNVVGTDHFTVLFYSLAPMHF